MLKYKPIEFNSSAIGRYEWRNRSILLDYNGLSKNPFLADMVIYHEMVHSNLFQLCDFSLALEDLNRIRPICKDEFKQKFIDSINRLSFLQINLHESIATYYGIRYVRRKYGKSIAENLVANSLPREKVSDYQYSYFDLYMNLEFLNNPSEKYRKLFFSKIPSIALNQGFRKDIVKLKLLEDEQNMENYFKDFDKIPDFRFFKLVDTIRSNLSILKKTTFEIAEKAGISHDQGTDEVEVSNFLNYLLENFTDEKGRVKPEDINSINKAQENFKLSLKNITIATTDLGIKNAEPLFMREDIEFYSDVIDAVFLTEVDQVESKEEIDFFKKFKNIICQSSFAAFRRTGEKYLFINSYENVIASVNTMSKATLMVKWGLLKPNDREVLNHPGIRRPNIVIYNNYMDMLSSFSDIKSLQGKFKWMHIQALNQSVLNTLIIEDHYESLHILNTTPKGIDEIMNNLECLESEQKDNYYFKKYALHITNIFTWWMGVNIPVDSYDIFFKPL